MMDYELLLKRVRENLPTDINKGERFDVTKYKADSFIEGNRSFVKNISAIADYLNRDVNHLIKFLGKELATSGSLEGTRGIFIGKFRKNIFDEKLEVYVNTFVKCKQCGSPDTKIETQDRVNIMKCMACQAKRPLPKIK
jgi:translation initiation factor 2 subunit 2